MKISVVIRTYNEEGNIKNCLEHFQAQELKPFEILLIDNESTDNTVAIARKFQKSLNLKIINNPVKGFPSGLNLGIEKSAGDWIAFISADCFPDKKWLYWLVNTAKACNADVVQGKEIPFPENYIHYVLRTESANSSKLAKQIMFFNNTNILYKKSPLTKEYPFTGLGTTGYAEDTLMSMKYQNRNLRAFFEPKATVKHNKFESKSAFKKRMVHHGEVSVLLFKNFPKNPRLYLNAFYWSAKEFLLFARKKDTRFLKVAAMRLFYNLQGIALGVGITKKVRRGTV